MTIKDTLFVSLIYTLLVTVITAFSFLPIHHDLFYWKEIFFGYWGYGWDGMHYIKIATDGYHFPLQAFFPMYPLLIRLADFALPLSIAQRINVILLPLVLWAILNVSKLMGVSKKKQKYVILGFLSFPSAFFLQANYTETLYIILAGLSLIALYNRKYWKSALLAGLLSGVKITGILLAPIIVYRYLTDQGLLRQRKIKKYITAIFIGLIAVTGCGVFFAYLSINYDSFLIYFVAQAKWHRGLLLSINSIKDFFVFPLSTIMYTRFSIYRVSLEYFSFFFVISLLIKSFKKIHPLFWMYSFLSFAVFVFSGSMMSLHRFLLLLFPLLIFFFQELSESKKLYYAVIFTSIVIQVAGIYLFHHNVFVG